MCNFTFSSHNSNFISSMLFANWKWCLGDSAWICAPIETSSKKNCTSEKKKIKCVCFIWKVQKYLDHYTSPFLLFFNISSSRHNSSCQMSWGSIMCGCSFSFSVIHCRLPSPLLSVTTTLNPVSLFETVIKVTINMTNLYPSFPNITRIYNFDIHTMSVYGDSYVVNICSHIRSHSKRTGPTVFSPDLDKNGYVYVSKTLMWIIVEIPLRKIITYNV